MLVPTRFSLLIVLAAGGALLLNDQVRDVLAGLGEPWWQVVFFFLAVTWWAIQSWGWARYILNATFPVDANGLRGTPGAERFLIDYLPRVYGGFAFAIAVIASVTSEAHWSVSVSLIIIGLAYFVYVVKRRRLQSTRLRSIGSAPPSLLWSFTFGIVALSVFFALLFPVQMGSRLGAGTVVFLGLGCIVPIGTLLVDRTRLLGFPIITTLLVLAALFSLNNDNHRVRVIELESGKAQPAAAAVPIKHAWTRWKAQVEPKDGTRQLVLVATAGGGLRASYWTAVVLGQLQDQVPGFHRHVFAISGVSGGTVGAVFFNAALAATPSCANPAGPGSCLQPKLLEAVGRDYLGPAATAMLYGDLMQRFWPWPVIADRASVLERAWEAGFSRIYPAAKCGLGAPFRAFYPERECAQGFQWLPIVLANGTYEEAGRRIVTSTLKIDPKSFLDSDDFYERHGQAALPASTAAHNSARFTYVSPAGTFGRDGAAEGHVIDGGYFENFGAETVSDVLRWIKTSGDPSRTDVELIVIVISNETKLRRSQFKDITTPESPAAVNFLNEVRAPLHGLLQTRTARGMLAFKALRSEVSNYCRDRNGCRPPTFVHFHLEEKSTANPPLGWVLSSPSKRNMERQVLEEHGKGDNKDDSNCAALRKVSEIFSVPAPACVTTE